MAKAGCLEVSKPSKAHQAHRALLVAVAVEVLFLVDHPYDRGGHPFHRDNAHACTVESAPDVISCHAFLPLAVAQDVCAIHCVALQRFYRAFPYLPRSLWPFPTLS